MTSWPIHENSSFLFTVADNENKHYQGTKVLKISISISYLKSNLFITETFMCVQVSGLIAEQRDYKGKLDTVPDKKLIVWHVIQTRIR
jgi:hypothetical protein